MNLFIPLAAAAVLLPQISPAQQKAMDNGMRPAVSPDGEWVAFGSNRDGTNDIYAMRLDGSGLARLTADSVQEGSIAWGRDGKSILFSVNNQDTARLYSVQLDGRNRTEILKLRGRNPMLSPDGKKVLYAVGGWQDMQVMVAGIDGSNPIQLSPAGAAYYNHRFSPDGSQVAVSRSAPSNMQAWLLGLDGKTSRALTNFPDGRPQAPGWSPDGRKIAVQSSVPYAGDPKKHLGTIWVIEVPTGTATRLADHAEPYLDETPSWFPDGKRLAFQSDRTGRWEIWVMNSDGTNQRQVTR